MKEKPKEEKDKEVRKAEDIVAERLIETLLRYYYWSKEKENKESKKKDSN